MMSLLAQAVGLAAIVVAFALTLFVIAQRSLFATAAGGAAIGALVAAAALSFGAGDLALGVALLAIGWAPSILLATMLLSVRSSRGAKRGAPWITIAAAGLAAAMIAMTLPDLPARAVSAAPVAAPALWLCVLALIAAAACVGLLGYGERGALERQRGDPP